MTSTYGRLSRKVLGAALAGTLGLSAAAALVPGVASANQTTTTQRVAGTDRYGTASTIATTAFPNGSNNIVLASGENFPDGLAAATLAGALGAPVLLTAKDTLPAVTASTAKTIDNGVTGTATIYIVGGTTAISQAVRTQLTSLGYTLNETGGADRYATASAVATKAAGIAASTAFNGLRTAIVATGETFPDALSAGTVAYSQKLPILLTPTATLGSSASTSLTSLGVQQAIIMGGTAAVSQATEDAIKAKGISVVRVAGTNRNDTAAKLATLEITPTGNGGFSIAGTQVYLASGLNFPDALASAPLAGGALGAATAGPILLTASLPAETAAFLATNKATITKVWAVGGTTAVSDADLTAAQTSATTAAPTATISATQGADRATVKFSEAVTAASAQSVTAYRRNNTALPGVSSVSYNAATTTATILLPGNVSWAAGDVISILPGVITTSDGRTVNATSFTVVADTVAPTATIKASTGSPSANKDVYVVFSEAVSTASTNPANDFGAADITIPGNATSSVTPITSTTFRATFTTNLTVGSVVTLATSYTDLAGVAPTAATTAAVVQDVVGAGLNSAKLTAVPAVQATATVGGTGTVTIAALATGSAAGAAGNAWSVTVVDNNGQLSVGVNTTSKTITIATDVNGSNAQQTTATAVAAALNGDATFKTLFGATAAAGAFSNTTGAGFLSGGLTAAALAATFTEPVDPAQATAGDFNLDLNGDGVAEISGAAPPSGTTVTVDTTNAVSAGVVVVTFTTGNSALVPTAGTSKLQVNALGVHDLAANQNLSQLTATVS